VRLLDSGSEVVAVAHAKRESDKLSKAKAKRRSQWRAAFLEWRNGNQKKEEK
jgi:hypothetical protein